MRNLIFLFFLSFTAFGEQPSYISFPSDVDWITKSSEHFNIIYREGQDAFANRTLRAAERAHQLLIPIFPEGPDKTWIVLADFQDSTNGYALNFPYSHIVLFASPPEVTGQLATLDDWLDSVVLHELVHIRHLYPAHGLWKPMRFIFGTWVVPNGMMPSHFHEGMATFLESELSRGGRGKGTIFSMYRRKAIEAGKWGNDFAPLDLMDGAATSRWPHGSSAYFFGEQLHRELWTRKGAKGFSDLTRSYSDNWPFFWQHGPLNSVFGVNYNQLWKEIYLKTEKEGLDEIKKIKQTPLSELQYLTKTRYRKLDVTFSPDGTKIAYRLDSPYRDDGGIQIMDLKKGKLLHDYTFSMGNSDGLCWGKSGSTEYLIFINTDTSLYNVHNHLYVMNLATEEKLILASLKASMPINHIHRIACTQNLSSIYVYKESGGEGFILENQPQLHQGSRDVRIAREWKIPEGFWVTSILASDPPIFGIKRGIQTVLYNWPKGKDPQQLFAINGVVHNLRAGSTPDEVHAITAIDGRDEVWKLDLKQKTGTKKIAVLGGINGFDVKGDSYVVSSYEHGGYDIARAIPITSEGKSISVAVEEEKETDASIKVSEPSSYSAFSTLLPKAWFPSFLAVPNGLQVGIQIPWFDLSQKHIYTLLGGYDTRGQLFADVSYVHRFWGNFSMDVGAYYFPTYIRFANDFLKRWGGSFGFTGTFSGLPFSIRLGGIFKRMEQSALSAGAQSVGAEITVTYTAGFTRRPLSISPVNGIRISANHQQYFKTIGSEYNFFSSTFSINGYVEAPWWKESVWFAGARLGYTEGSPFYNSYFESGGEILLSLAQASFRNRGFLPGSFLGRRLFNGNLEYRFPIARIERGMGLGPLFAKTFHGAIVGDVTSYDVGPSAVSRNTGQKLPEDIFKLYYYSAGLELKLDTKIVYYLPATFRVGVYHGFGGPDSQDIQVVLGMEASL